MQLRFSFPCLCAYVLRLLFQDLCPDVQGARCVSGCSAGAGTNSATVLHAPGWVDWEVHSPSMLTRWVQVAAHRDAFADAPWDIYMRSEP